MARTPASQAGEPSSTLGETTKKIIDHPQRMDGAERRPGAGRRQAIFDLEVFPLRSESKGSALALPPQFTDKKQGDNVTLNMSWKSAPRKGRLTGVKVPIPLQKEWKKQYFA